MLYNIIVAPIEYIVGWIFMFIINKLPSLGVIGAICGVSVAINILALPLYNIAESIQENERQINKKLEYRVKRIKKGFKGDEQFMMLSEYYRQNGYHPIYALRGSLSILIEIPFFIAAYNYLSSSEVLKESSFWIFSNLGEADNMFTIALGSLVIPINILPIIMTTINFVSGYIYTKDATTRDKIQIYVLGIVFLVLLYNSPSGLVIYWILNNVFSLMKNVVRKTKYPGRFLHAFISVILVALTFRFRNASVRSRFYLVLVFALAFILFPLFISYFKKKNIAHAFKTIGKMETKHCLSVTIISGLALAALCGFLLPASTIASSPEEFSYLGSVSNPSSYVWSSLWFFVGLFVFWPLCIYKMFGEKVRFLESVVLFTLLAVALADVFIFTGEYGTLDIQFYAENSTSLDCPATAYKIGPVLVVVVALAFYLVINSIDRIRIVSLLCLSVTIAEFGIGGVKLASINSSFKKYTEKISLNSDSEEGNSKIQKVYHLSKEGKNVVVLFLDRAFSGFFPYALEKLPELNDQLSGFVYYPNTVSFGGCTTFASPAMMGGYEYTPEKMNDRDGLLVDIHNEASLVTPTLFRDAGYTVTVTDPPFPNYSWKGDLSAFEDVDGINAKILNGKYSEDFFTELGIISNADIDASLLTQEGAVNFSMLQILPPLFRYTFETSCRKINKDYGSFVDSFSSLYYLPEITDFSGTSNAYVFIANDSTHEPEELGKDLIHMASENDYFESNYPYSSESTYKHYSVFVAAMKQVGKWLDYLKTNGVYDNTRIIIVADHARSLESDIVDDSRTSFLPLLLVKDFNSRGEIKTDYTFMTNADTILLATECLEEVSDVNPYTGNKLKSEKDEGINAYLMVNDDDWNAPVIIKNDSFTLDKNEGWHISENIFDESCWVHISEWEEERK